MERQTGLDLLKIIATVGVISVHYAGEAIGLSSHNSSIILGMGYILSSLSVNSVNVFIMIMGYFYCDREKLPIKKVVKLYFEALFVRMLFYFVECFADKERVILSILIQIIVPLGYFFILYVCLYILAPYVNILLKNLPLKDMKKLVVTIFALFSLWTILIDIGGVVIGHDIESASPIGLYGSQSGYTIINFLMLYIIGAYARRMKREKIIVGHNIKSLMICCGAFYMLIFICQEINYKIGSEYCNPVVVGSALFVFFSLRGWN